MIGKLKGTLDEIDEDHCVVDVHGVGYVAYCPARTLAALPWLIPEALATLLPPLRSHFIYMAKKPETDRAED